MKRAALLRAVNVGGRKVPMAELRAALSGEFGEVTTLLASGNAIIEAEGDAAALELRLEQVFAARFGFASEFLIRDAAELDAIIAANPFPAEAEDHPSRLLVTFFREAPSESLGAQLAAEHAGPERTALIGRELYADYPNGQADTTLDRTMRRLKWPKLATGRNWNTVLKLRAALD